MTKTVKRHGRVYTPAFLVNIILDFGGYNSKSIITKHVIDNSCGDGAFLSVIVNRYCTEYLKASDDIIQLKKELETYIHGIEIDNVECSLCVENLNRVAAKYRVENVNWNILNADSLMISEFDGRMDYIFGNPPYVRVHNLDDNYDAVKKFRFAQSGMTDLFIVFFEIGFRMMKKGGLMCIITPSSWLNSEAGKTLRNAIEHLQILTGIIDLEHFQAFNATTYTLISRFDSSKRSSIISYYTLSDCGDTITFKGDISLDSISICGNLYPANNDDCKILREIMTGRHYKYATVKNGLATLADKVFIGDFIFTQGTIPIIKASTGKWSKCIYPYDVNGKPLSLDQFRINNEAYLHLSDNYDKLSKGRDIEKDSCWYLFGRTQALIDVSKRKVAINTIIKDINTIRIEEVNEGEAVYSGLYILSDFKYEIIRDLIKTDEFIKYVRMLKKYKSGGYYTFSSKDLEHFINYKLTEKYGQSGFSSDSWGIFQEIS